MYVIIYDNEINNIVCSTLVNFMGSVLSCNNLIPNSTKTSELCNESKPQFVVTVIVFVDESILTLPGPIWGQDSIKDVIAKNQSSSVG